MFIHTWFGYPFLVDKNTHKTDKMEGIRSARCLFGNLYAISIQQKDDMRFVFTVLIVTLRILTGRKNASRVCVNPISLFFSFGLYASPETNRKNF